MGMGRIDDVCGWDCQLLLAGPHRCTFLLASDLVQYYPASATLLRYSAKARSVCFILV